jgi:hypothetical protein
MPADWHGDYFAARYLVSGAIHNWSLQLPDPFTQTVRAGITEQLLPGALVALK